MRKTGLKLRIICLCAATALSLTLGGCWETMWSLVPVSHTEVANPYTGETRVHKKYADGFERWIYVDQNGNKSVVNVDKHGVASPVMGAVDPRTVDEKRIIGDRIKSLEEEVARLDKRVRRMLRPTDPFQKKFQQLAWDDLEFHEGLLRKQRREYIAKYSEAPPSIYGDDARRIYRDLPASAADLPGLPPTTGVTGAGAFTPPDVPTGPLPGAIVRPTPRPPMPPMHPD